MKPPSVFINVVNSIVLTQDITKRANDPAVQSLVEKYLAGIEQLIDLKLATALSAAKDEVTKCLLCKKSPEACQCSRVDIETINNMRTVRFCFALGQHSDIMQIWSDLIVILGLPGAEQVIEMALKKEGWVFNNVGSIGTLREGNAHHHIMLQYDIT